MKSTEPYLGSCLCGGIKYAIEEMDQKMGHCHCKMCRKFHGAAFATYGFAKTENFHWLEGEELLREYTAENGTKRLFCEKCGSSLIFVPSNSDESTVEVALGSLDSDLDPQPAAHIFTNYAASWFSISDDLKKYPEDRTAKDTA